METYQKDQSRVYLPKASFKWFEQRQTNQPHLDGFNLDALWLMVWGTLHGREKIAHQFSRCNNCCKRIDMMQRTMLYTATLIVRYLIFIH
jgi:hypothetical protein